LVADFFSQNVGEVEFTIEYSNVEKGRGLIFWENIVSFHEVAECDVASAKTYSGDSRRIKNLKEVVVAATTKQ
jgi:hypothetical protein